MSKGKIKLDQIVFAPIIDDECQDVFELSPSHFLPESLSFNLDEKNEAELLSDNCINVSVDQRIPMGNAILVPTKDSKLFYEQKVNGEIVRTEIEITDEYIQECQMELENWKKRISNTEIQ